MPAHISSRVLTRLTNRISIHINNTYIYIYVCRRVDIYIYIYVCMCISGHSLTWLAFSPSGRRVSSINHQTYTLTRITAALWSLCLPPSCLPAWSALWFHKKRRSKCRTGMFYWTFGSAIDKLVPSCGVLVATFTHPCQVSRSQP